MEDIDHKFISHKLNINLAYTSVKQKKQEPRKEKVVDDEFDKFIVTRFIWDVHYP